MKQNFKKFLLAITVLTMVNLLLGIISVGRGLGKESPYLYLLGPLEFYE